MDQSTSLIGQVIPRRFNAGFIVLSCVVSYVGSLTTLELLNRRTAGNGKQNWFLLVAGAISMGGVSIWSMHFLGNRAIILGDGNNVFQIVYSSGYTALSFFVPVLVLLGAFFSLGTDEKAGKVRVIAAGTLAGLAVCGMHYVGQLGIYNFQCEYSIGHVIGSVIVAIFAANIALSIFFVLHSIFASSWLQRASVAAILAGAVSAMHWTASTGTTYRLVSAQRSDGDSLSRNTVVIIVSVFALIACVTLMTFAVLAQRRRSLQADRAQQVVLACAYFDQEGRIMVTPEGQLVNTKITKSYLERSFDEVFGTGHPVFRWIYQVSRNWTSITDLLPAMRAHLRGVPQDDDAYRTSTRASTQYDVLDETVDYSIIFRELFCLAAAELAEQLNEPIEKLGVLYDRIVKTGTVSKSEPKERMKVLSSASYQDVELGCVQPPIVFGRGQMLFLSREVSPRDQAKLQAQGYRFAPTQHVVEIIARSMQIDTASFIPRVECMRKFCHSEPLSESGVHVGCFGIRAGLHGGFDLLVRSDARCQLPSIRLPYLKLNPSHLDYLQQLHGLTVSSCLQQLRYSPAGQNAEQQDFASHLHEAIIALSERLAPVSGVESFFQDARFICTPVSIPCQWHGPTDVRYPGPDSATLFTFKLIFPIHSRAPNNRLEFTPLSFFRTQQQSFRGTLDLEVFARSVHREFSSILEGNRATTANPRTEKRFRATLRNKHSDGKLSFWSGLQGSSTPSEKSLMGLANRPAYGGIMVSQTVTVDIQDAELKETGSLDTGNGMVGKGIAEGMDEHRPLLCARVEALREEGENPTFVDDLLAQCFDRR